MTIFSCTSKACLCGLSVILWAAAAGLAAIGVRLLMEYNEFGLITSDTYALVPAVILIAVALFIFILGVIGCVGAFKEHKCLLGVFTTVLLLVFVGMVSVVVLAYFYRGRVTGAVHDGIQTALRRYGNESDVTADVDLLQAELHCCGLDNYTDWLATPWYVNASMPYPDSCCRHQACHYGNETGLYTQGCYTLLKTQFLSHLSIVVAVAAALACIQLLGMVAACILICRRKPTPPYLQFDQPQGMRV